MLKTWLVSKRKEMDNTLYERDFYQWIQTTAEYLKQRQFDLVDWDNLIEEFESIGKAQKGEIRERLLVLVNQST